MRARAIPLAMITMRKSTHGSVPFLSYRSMGLRLAALRAAGTPLWRLSGLGELSGLSGLSGLWEFSGLSVWYVWLCPWVEVLIECRSQENSSTTKARHLIYLNFCRNYSLRVDTSIRVLKHRDFIVSPLKMPCPQEADLLSLVNGLPWDRQSIKCLANGRGCRRGAWNWQSHNTTSLVTLK